MIDNRKYIKTSSNLLDYFVYKEIIDLQFNSFDEKYKRDKILSELMNQNLNVISNTIVVYGSYTYNSLTSKSDLDLIGFTNKSERPQKRYFRFWDNYNKEIIPVEIVYVPIEIKSENQWYGLSGTTNTKEYGTFPMIGTIAFSIPELWKQDDFVREKARLDADRIIKYIAKSNSCSIYELKENDIIKGIIELISWIFNPNIPSFKPAIGELNRRLSNGLIDIWKCNIQDTITNQEFLPNAYIEETDEKKIKYWLRKFTLDRLIDMGNLEFAKYYKYDFS